MQRIRLTGCGGEGRAAARTTRATLARWDLGRSRGPDGSRALRVLLPEMKEDREAIDIIESCGPTFRSRRWTRSR